MDALAKKHSAESGSSTTEFHCSRTWFIGEKPVKFKKGATKGVSLCVGGVRYHAELEAGAGKGSVKAELADKTADTALMVLQEPGQRGKHLAHLVK